MGLGIHQRVFRNYTRLYSLINKRSLINSGEALSLNIIRMKWLIVVEESYALVIRVGQVY